MSTFVRERNRGSNALFLACATLMLASGCATLSLGPKRLVDTEVVTESRVSGRHLTVAGEVQSRGDRVSVYAVHQCELRDELVRTVEYTSSQDRDIVQDDPRPLVLLAAAAGMAVGSFLYLDAASLAEDAKQEAIEKGEKSYMSANDTRTTGAVFFGLGAIGVMIVIVDTIRATTTEDSTETRSERRFASGAHGYCGDAPLAGATVTATTAEQVTELGTTDDHGTLELDAGELRERLGGESAQLSVSGVRVGTWPL